MPKKRIAVLTACSIAGSFVINFTFVSGSITFLDCRAILVVDRGGCMIPNTLSAWRSNRCLPELPPFSICPVTILQTEYECRVVQTICGV